MDLDEVVMQGELKKQNEWWIKQVRLFVLCRDGQVKYYKDQTLHRGSINLCKNTRVVKTSQTSVEVVTPARTFYLFEAHNKASTVDKWII